jgi:hypothetical protein
MPNEEVLQKIAAASTPDEVQAILDESGAKLVYKDESGDAPEKGPPKGPPKEKGPPKDPLAAGGDEPPDEGGGPMPFGRFAKRSLRKNMKKFGGEVSDG